MRIFRPCRSATVFISLRNQPPICVAGVAGRHAVHVMLGEELVHQVHAAAVIHPGVFHARVQPQRDRRREGEGRVLADVVVGRGLAHLDGAVRNRIGELERADDLARREGLDLELAVGGLADVFGDGLGAAVDGVERLRKARAQAPFDLGHGLRDRGLRNRRGRKADAGRLQELTTFHSGSPPPLRGFPLGPRCRAWR